MPHPAPDARLPMPSTRTRTTRRGLAFRLLTMGGALASILSFVIGSAGEATAATTHNPRGAVDSFTVANALVRASGWAFDPDSTASVRVWSTIDGINQTAVLAHNPRPDVAAAFPGAGPTRGFVTSFTVPNGTHRVCIVAANYGAGANTTLRCSTITMNNNPIGDLNVARPGPGGVQVSGWALDPNSTGPVRVAALLDGRPAVMMTANLPRSDIAAAYPYYGAAHGFSGTVSAPDGVHNVCIAAANLAIGSNSGLPCRRVQITHSPLGSLQSSGRLYGTSDWLSVNGWAFDPDTASPSTVAITVDGAATLTMTANRAASNVAASYPAYGSSHGYLGSLHLDGREHLICAVGRNVGLGTDKSLGCFRIPSTGTVTPAAPTGVQAWPGNTAIDLTWTGATSTAAPLTSFSVVMLPGGATVATVSGAARRATIRGLLNGHNYSFGIRATNSLGTGTATWVTTRPSAIPPQFSAAPVSTSHYLRNLTGSAATDTAIARAMGATDASNNPSGHRYLVLLQVGGQDESRKGALLSATSKFVSYPAVVTALKAYLDGYHSKQKPNAPVVVAVGTNNDVDVSQSAGISWAVNVVNPLRSYAPRYPNIEIAGANDIEPGFSATAGESRAWLTGFLAATPGRFVFNGSADGCSPSTAGSSCNNGWRMSDLQWLSGGAAPSRTISLPQIYNSTMPLQWKFISLTGVSGGKPRLYFGGPLTEWTACAQAGSCGSITNVDAWNKLWAAISSSSSTRQYDMPNGTDLRIN